MDKIITQAGTNLFEPVVRIAQLAHHWIVGAGRAATVRSRQRRAVRRQMRTLAQLDDRMLRDIGINRQEIGSIAAELTGSAEKTRRQAGC